MITVLFSVGCGLYIGYVAGWVNAHRKVEKECDLLGRFFVGKKVFYCSRIADAADAINRKDQKEVFATSRHDAEI